MMHFGLLAGRQYDHGTIRRQQVQLVTTAEMENIREELQRVSTPGTDPVEQASVLTWALQYAGAYFKTPRGSLRRAFPKDMRKIRFN